jgi:nitrite reductase (NAD(P)H)
VDVDVNVLKPKQSKHLTLHSLVISTNIVFSFALITSEKGFNISVGGFLPKTAKYLSKMLPPDDVIPIVERCLLLYIRTVDRLQRTARWPENLPEGTKYLREAILEDS